MMITYDIHELAPYINWVYFFYAWQVKNEEEKARLRQEAETLLTQWEGHYHAYGLFELYEAYADGDVLREVRMDGSGGKLQRPRGHGRQADRSDHFTGHAAGHG